MSEQLPLSSHERPAADSEVSLPEAERAERSALDERQEQQQTQEKLEIARETIQTQTETAGHDNPLDRLQAAEKAQTELPRQHINRELKQITLQRELKQLRHKLPAPQRTLSKIVHQPAVRAVSEATAKSLTRPSGLLGGGLVAFFGSSAYLYLAKHIGFTYNYFVFVLLFGGGFIFGILLEILVWTLTVKRRHLDS